MKNAFKLIKGISRALDIIAGAGIVVITVMVVLNVLLRTVFNVPFRGIYEYVSYLTAAVIGLALAYCAVNNAHISIGFIMEKLPLKLRAVIDIVTKAAVLVFLGVLTCQTALLGYNTALSGEVSPTVRIPFYPFIYLVAAGVFMLGVVVLFHLAAEIKGVIKK